MITIFILIYLISFASHLLLEYRENKYCIHDIGDLIDSIKFYMCFPLLNTITLIFFVIVIFIMKLWELLKIDILWEKFRNIRLN
jgi:hypothetical protein